MRDAPRATPTSAEPAVDPFLGRLIAGKFAVEERLGAGAMGIVYRARQVALDRTVAIKVLHHEFASDADFAERFAREAKAASRLDHPNSIRVLDFGQEPDGLLYLVMEYVEGSDLFEWLDAHRPIPPRTIVEILAQALAALALAHDMGVVHRDLKPENILMVRGLNDEGRAVDVVKVCDFGIAKFLDPTASATEGRRKHSTTGLIVGTPAYMSPEQARGEKQDARSDVYAAGVILYELLAGRLPFEAETLIGVALKHVNEVPEKPSSFTPGVDPSLEAICLKALQKKPIERYQSAREMRLSLIRAAESSAFGAHFAATPSASFRLGTPDSSRPTLAGISPGTPAPRARRSRAWLGLIALPALLLLGFVGLRRSSERESAVTSSVSASLAAVIPSNAAAASVVANEPPSASSPPNEIANEASLASSANKRAPITASKRVRSPEAPAHANALNEAAPSEPPAMAEPEPVRVAPPAPDPVLVAAPAPSPPVEPKSAAIAPIKAAPVAPTADPALASVALGGARNAIGATAISVTRALSAAAPRITACYKAALPALGSAFEGTDTLHIETDGAGVITDARLSGPVRGNLGACIASAVQGRRVANVDTGSASADVPLSFRDH